jgi:hypothetical protein
MNITRKALACGHCETTTVCHGDTEYSYQLFMEHQAYHLRSMVRIDGVSVFDQSYVARVAGTTIACMNSLYRQAVACAGMCHLYSFMSDRIRYDVFSSNSQQARVMIQNLHGVPADQLIPLSV